jgi:hypothetical protein
MTSLYRRPPWDTTVCVSSSPLGLVKMTAAALSELCREKPTLKFWQNGVYVVSREGLVLDSLDLPTQRSQAKSRTGR